MNIKVVPDGKVHEQRFSWLTTCGIPIVESDADEFVAEETEDDVTCKRCLQAARHHIVRQYGIYGVLIDKDINRFDWISYHLISGGSARDASESYTIDIVEPKRDYLDNRPHLNVQLANDEEAISLAEAFCYWLIRRDQGYLFEMKQAEP